MNNTAKTITESQRMTVIGLLTLGADLQAQLDLVVRALINTTGEESRLGSHCEDVLYGYTSRDKVRDADQLIKRLGLTVVPDEKLNEDIETVAENHEDATS